LVTERTEPSRRLDDRHRLQTVPDTARLTAASALQKLLPELVALALNAKQAQWNVTGPAFLPLHALTDEIAADLRTWVDRVAERAVALGFTVEARPGTVAPVGGQFPAGRVSDHEAIAEPSIPGLSAGALSACCCECYSSRRVAS